MKLQGLDIDSMLQSYRQLNATKDTKNFGITLDSINPTQKDDSIQTLDLHNEIEQMKTAWFTASSLTFTSSPDAMLVSSKNLWDFFGYNKAGFRDSIAVRANIFDTDLGVLNFDEIMQKNFELLEQNPRYADAMDYRYETIVSKADNGTVIERYFKPEYDVQVSVFHSRDEEIEIVDKGYHRTDFDEAAKKIEKTLDRILEEQFQNNPDSQSTNILLLLKAKLQAMPEIIQQIHTNAIDYTRKAIDEVNEDALVLAVSTADLEIASEIRIFHDVSVQLAQYLSAEEQQQIIDAKDIIINYYQNNWNRDFAFKGLDPLMQFALANAAKMLAENMKNIAVDDDAETLLDLGTEKRMDYESIISEETPKESLFNRIKKMKTDDTILQKIMATKAKTAN